MHSLVHSVGIRGITGFSVDVECSSQNRLPNFNIVGLPDTAVKEAKERVRSACENSGIKFPSVDLTVNLAPANMKKEGSFFDIAILLSILKSCARLPSGVSLDGKCFVGELSLSGELRRISGVLSMAAAATNAGFTELYVPAENANEAAAVGGVRVYGVRSIGELLAHLSGKIALEEQKYQPSASDISHAPVDFSDVKGQNTAKRALEIAAAGGHNVLLIGPPGSGKSMLAKCLPTILPRMSFTESVESTMIHSVAGEDLKALLPVRPFRAPHHTVSAVGLVGGGTNPRPGEVSLAHNGVLFLDEFPEFGKHLIDSLRQPVEDGTVTVTRASGSVTYPSRFMLICAMNPCRCGHFGDPNGKCTCSPESVKRYLSKVSGPMLDRMDIQVELPSLTYDEMSKKSEGTETSAQVRERVERAREISRRRCEALGTDAVSNASLTPAQIRELCKMDAGAEALMRAAFERLGLSARAHDKILRVARTIADLDGSESILGRHIAEAIQYRSLDRKYWS